MGLLLWGRHDTQGTPHGAGSTPLELLFDIILSRQSSCTVTSGYNLYTGQVSHIPQCKDACTLFTQSLALCIFGLRWRASIVCYCGFCVNFARALRILGDGAVLCPNHIRSPDTVFVVASMCFLVFWRHTLVCFLNLVSVNDSISRVSIVCVCELRANFTTALRILGV